MRVFQLAFAVLLSLPILCRAQQSFADVLGELPACSVTCIVGGIPDSMCETLANTTCLCADTELYETVLTCVRRECTPLEAIDTARVEANVCQRPDRSRKADLLAPLSIEILAFASILLRLYSRWRTVSHFEADDCIMMLVLVLYVIFESIGLTAGYQAFGEDVWRVDIAVLTHAFKLFFIAESFYLAILALTKISILFFFLRIFPNRCFRIATYVVMTWIGISGIVFIFLQIFQCMPVQYSWEGWLGEFGEHHCIVDLNSLTFSVAAFSIAQILVMLVMPLPLLWKLNTSLRSKIAIIIMFSLGIFDLITSCIRLRSIILFGDSVNPSWDYTDTLIWTGLETSVSIIVSSLPAIRVLFKHLDASSNFWATTKDNNNPEAGTMCGDRVENVTSLNVDDSAPSSNGSRTFVGSISHSVYSSHTIHVNKRRSAQDALFAHMSNESSLHLGDKMRGDVRTEIGVGEKADSEDTGHGGSRKSSGLLSSSNKSSRHASLRRSVESLECVPGVAREGSPGANEASVSPPSAGILVQTTTTTTVATSPPSEGWEARYG